MSKDILNHPLLIKRRQEVQDNLSQFSERGFDKDTFCPMPFLAIILEPDGSVGFCRHKGTKHRLGNLAKQSWKEIWNGEPVKKWRREFLEGKPQICAEEIHDRHCNLCPELGKLIPRNPYNFQEEMPAPIRLTANFNGQCNLKCQMCDVWELPNGRYTEENFWSQARTELFPHVKEVDLLSGEPFIQADTFKLIDEVSQVNPECQWTFTTNAHWKLNSKRKEALDKIHVKNIILSVDSFNPDVYAKIRRQGNLEMVLRTIDDLNAYEKERVDRGLSTLNMNLNFLVQKDNWTEVSQAISYCLNKNINPFMTFCYLPKEHSLLDLPKEQRKEIIKYYLNTMDWGELTLVFRLINPLLQTLPKIERVEFLSQLEKKKDTYENRSNAL